MLNPATTLFLTIGDKSRQLNKIETTDTVGPLSLLFFTLREHRSHGGKPFYPPIAVKTLWKPLPSTI